jgi:hypothetical protein
MKTITRFIVRAILVVLALIMLSPCLLIIVECESTFLPNFLGLAYVASLILIYRSEDADGWLHKFVWLYRIAFREFFPDL